MKNARSLLSRPAAVVSLIACIGAAHAFGQGALSVALNPSLTSPQPVGSLVTFAATASGSVNGNVWYRFRARAIGASSQCQASPRLPQRANCGTLGYSVVRDYGPVGTLDYTASEREGDYQIEVSARDLDTSAYATTTAIFTFASRVAVGGAPVIGPTANNLVFLYSAAPCPIGATMAVVFQGPDGYLQSTNSKACDGASSMNFYLAGMRAQSAYSVQHVVNSAGQYLPGPILALPTPADSFNFGARTLTVGPPASMPRPIILQARFGYPAATDPLGNVLWYSLQNISMLARPEPGGLFLGWYEGTGGMANQFIREFDLAGTVRRETNAARVNEQLAAMGMHPIVSFHHEVRALPDGGILTMGASERILTDVQGPGPVDVLGDIILVLNSNLQVKWAWDTFDHLDNTRMATLGETCTGATGGCPPIQLAAVANDWTHGNSLQLTPDGNILYSARHQDLLYKIDYENGQGTGAIIWRLGKGGDFQFASADPYPWFSHQHDANLDANGTLTVFDNGNVRNAADPTANSRGMAIQLDETNYIATPLVSQDLGDYSMALGSAQSLPDGTYHFHLGYIPVKNSTRIVAIDSKGNLIYDLHIGELQYRSFRMTDLYTP